MLLQVLMMEQILRPNTAWLLDATNSAYWTSHRQRDRAGYRLARLDGKPTWAYHMLDTLEKLQQGR